MRGLGRGGGLEGHGVVRRSPWSWYKEARPALTLVCGYVTRSRTLTGSACLVVTGVRIPTNHPTPTGHSFNWKGRRIPTP